MTSSQHVLSSSCNGHLDVAGALLDSGKVAINARDSEDPSNSSFETQRVDLIASLWEADRHSILRHIPE